MHNTTHQRTLVLLKPEAVRRYLIGRIITTYEEKGLVIRSMRMLRPTSALIRRHYAAHVNKPFFRQLHDHLVGHRVVALVLAGRDAVAVVRHMHGSTDPEQAAPGTIRYAYGMCVGRNVVHGSASVEEAEQEIGMWFDSDDDNDMGSDVDSDVDVDE